MPVYYFSYGSNMSIRRLQARAPSAIKIDIGILQKHTLAFDKISRKDGSAKCNINETGDPTHTVHGVVFHITAEDKLELDRIEGAGFGYEQKTVEISLKNGTVIDAFTYFATDIDAALKPLDWYRDHVLMGARENGLPQNYIRAIEAIECIEDTDRERRDLELCVYRE